MLAILFTNLTFLSSLVYVILEEKKNFYKSNKFWLLTIAFLASLYIAIYYLKISAGSNESHFPL